MTNPTSNEKTMSHQNSGPNNYVHKQFHAQVVEQKDAKIMRLRAALHRINKWFGEFPPTGKTWADGSAMSYGAAYGSNGERDYMRQIAHEALSGDSSAPTQPRLGDEPWPEDSPPETRARQRFSVTGRFIPLSENGVPQNGLTIIHETTHDVYICDDEPSTQETSRKRPPREFDIDSHQGLYTEKPLDIHAETTTDVLGGCGPEKPVLGQLPPEFDPESPQQVNNDGI